MTEFIHEGGPLREPDPQFFVELESKVWAAQVSGDADADRELLSEDFVGLYPTGFAERDAHVEQLADGPILASYAITQARLTVVSEAAVLLSYRADYRRPGRDGGEATFVSSLWEQRDGRWWNTFSQDTPTTA